MSEKREDNAPALGGRSARTGREPRLGGDTALHHLALSLESDDWRTRKQAADSLRDLGPGATTLLIEALRSENMHTRRVAAQTLGLIGGDEAIEALVGAMKDRRELVGQDAFTGLLRILTQVDTPEERIRVMRAVLPWLTRNPIVSRLRVNLDALVPELVECLLDENAENRALAWKTLHDRPAIAALRQIGLRYPLLLIGCLAKVSDAFEGDDRALIDAARRELVNDLLWLVRTDAASDEVIAARERLQTYPLARYILIYRALLRANDPHVRLISIHAMRLERNPDIELVLIDILAHDPYMNVRVAAADILVRLMGDRAIPVLEEAARSEPWPYTFCEIVEMLCDLNPGMSHQYWLEMADSNDRTRRGICLGGLTESIKAFPCSEAVARQALELFSAACDSDFHLRSPAFKGLAALAGLEAYEEIAYDAESLLFRKLDRTSDHELSFAFYILPYIAPKLATRYLITKLNDDLLYPDFQDGPPPGYDEQRRCDIAAERLEAIGTPEALAAVETWRREQNQGPERR